MIIKYAKDVRYNEAGIATHCGMSLPAVATNVLGDLTHKSNDYDVVGIDEIWGWKPQKNLEWMID